MGLRPSQINAYQALIHLDTPNNRSYTSPCQQISTAVMVVSYSPDTRNKESCDSCLAFRDIQPQAPVHILVIPKKVIAGIQHATDTDAGLLGHLLVAAKCIAEEQGIASTGYRLTINAGDDGGQTVEHLHVHLIGGRAMGWPPTC